MIIPPGSMNRSISLFNDEPEDLFPYQNLKNLNPKPQIISAFPQLLNSYSSHSDSPFKY